MLHLFICVNSSFLLARIKFSISRLKAAKTGRILNVFTQSCMAFEVKFGGRNLT